MFEELISFVQSQYPDEFPVPLHAPRFRGNEKAYLEECIDSTYVSYLGPFVKKFEQQVCEYTASKYAVAVSSGTSALQLALMASGVERGHEVIVPTLTFVATANAVSYLGAHCVFVDSELDSLGLSPTGLEEFLSQNAARDVEGKLRNKKTQRQIVAVVPVHVFGHPCRIREIVAVASRFGLKVIEDATESLGSTSEGRHMGTFGEMGVLSFNGNKIVTTGGGGMVLTQDPGLASRVSHLSTTAKVAHPYLYDHDEVGFNFRLPNVNAAIGCAQMEQIRNTVENKRQLAEQYEEFFLDKGIAFVKERPGTRANYWLNAILLESNDQQKELLELGFRRGVQLRPPWRPLHTLSMYSSCETTGLGQAVDIARRVVCLPSSVRMGGND